MSAWVAVAALAAAAAAALALPLLRRPRAGAARADFDIAVFRRQLAELDSDAARGAIAEPEARAARAEIQRRILAAADSGGAAPDPPDNRGRAGALCAAALGAPLLSLAIYAAIGSPHLPDRPLAGRAAPNAMPADVAAAIDRLADRLREEPGDLGGWLLLARSYAATGRLDAAADAWANAAALAPGDADIAAAHGETLVHAAGGAVTPAARRRFDAALAIDPGHPGARYYLGLAAAQAGDPRRALDIWAALAEDSEPGAPWMPELRRRLGEAAAELGVEPPAGARAADPPAPDDAVAAIANLPPEEREAAIAGMVARLETRLRDAPDDAAGWRRLGRAKRALGDLPAAREAWRRAVELAPDDAVALAALAHVERALDPAGGPVPEAARALWRRVLALDPEHPEALWLLGLAASRDRPEEAAAFWRRLLALLPPDSAERRLLADRLAALAAAE